MSWGAGVQSGPGSSEKPRSQSAIMLQSLPCANRTLEQFVLALCARSHVIVTNYWLCVANTGFVLVLDVAKKMAADQIRNDQLKKK